MPTSLGKSRKEIFSCLRDRVSARIDGWGEKQLSKAGKEVLIKAVLQSIPTYTVSCFSLPVSLVRDIEAAIQRFWWGKGKSRAMAWVSWRNLCKPKDKGGMGFRDLRSFNLAMLAKQVWRVLTNPGLLLSQILRARYFPSGDLWTASIGARPPATWRSLLQARHHVRQGLRVRIGNGLDTSIWGDPWLLDDGNYHILTRRPMHSSFPNRVSDIIDNESRSWNIEFINEFFWPIDRQRILGVPIGSLHANDRVVWHYSQSGQFSVKTCYYNILAHCPFPRGNNGQGNTSSCSSSSHLWKLIWKLQIPPKIKIFLWRATMDILPTQTTLTRRHISTNPFCQFCGKQPETIMHVLCKCRGMEQVWHGAPFEQETIGEELPSFSYWLDFVRKKLTLETLTLAMVVCWKAWENRNKDVHGEERIDAQEVVKWCDTYLAVFRSAQCTPLELYQQPSPVVWTPPPNGVVKINCDAALPRDKDFYRVSLVARDCTGSILWWSVETIHGKVRPVDGEAHAVLKAILKASAKGWPSIIIEGDSLQVITVVQKEDPLFTSFGAFVEDIRSCMLSFHSCMFSFVKRSCNKLAHALASYPVIVNMEGPSLPPDLVSIE